MAGGRVPVTLISNANPAYIRRDLGDLTELTRSIKKTGLRAPILCDSSYFILDGARRFEVMKRAGATEVYCLATDDWETIRDMLIAGAERHKTDPYLQRSYVDIAESVPRLYDLKRVHTVQMGVETRRLKRKPLTSEEFRNQTVAAVLSQALGMDQATVQAICRAGNVLAEHRFRGEAATAERIIAALEESERLGLRSAIKNMVDHAVDPSIRLHSRIGGPRKPPEPPTVKLPSAAFIGQANTIRRILATLTDTVIAIPDGIDVRHSDEDITRWKKQISQIHTQLGRLKKKLITIEQEREDGGSEASE